MNQFEKVEKLREHAAVSYEDAKRALEESGWDLLEAMVLLEKEGKASDAGAAASYADSGNADGKKEKKKRRSPITLFRNFVKVCRDNNLCVTRKEKEVIRIPAGLLLLSFLFFWKITTAVMIAGLFLDFRYGFEGKDEVKTANKIAASVNGIADQVKDEFNDFRKNDSPTATVSDSEASSDTAVDLV